MVMWHPPTREQREKVAAELEELAARLRSTEPEPLPFREFELDVALQHTDPGYFGVGELDPEVVAETVTIKLRWAAWP